MTLEHDLSPPPDDDDDDDGAMEVYLNDLQIGTADDWNGAAEVLLGYAIKAFAPATRLMPHNNNVTESMQRWWHFLKAMGYKRPQDYVANESNCDEGDSHFRFLFANPGK